MARDNPRPHRSTDPPGDANGGEVRDGSLRLQQLGAQAVEGFYIRGGFCRLQEGDIGRSAILGEWGEGREEE